MKAKIKKYLTEKGISTEKKLLAHIEELKAIEHRDIEQTRILSSLVWCLCNRKDELSSFFAANKRLNTSLAYDQLYAITMSKIEDLLQKEMGDWDVVAYIGNERSKEKQELMDKINNGSPTYYGEGNITFTVPVKTSKKQQEKLEKVREICKQEERINCTTFQEHLDRIREEKVTVKEWNDQQDKDRRFNDWVDGEKIRKESNIQKRLEYAEALKKDAFEKHNVPYEGIKETEGKLTYEISWEFLEEVARRMQNNKGDKYPPYNWKLPMTPKGIEDLKQALNRHHIEVMKGNYRDGEEEFGHVVSYACNSMMLWHQLNNQKP